MMVGLMFPKPEKKEKTRKRLVARTPLRAKKRYQYKPKKMKPTVSIIQPDKSYCFLCGSSTGYGLNALEEHHIFEGNGKRTVSESYGLKVYLCGITCHREGPKSAHKNKEIKDMLHKLAQQKFEETHSREEFVLAFGKNYLPEEEI
ncbi:MAG: hypothetical protein IJP13_08525 [Lachnospiraceae bacterium]|nr:hypothetical protein [Lachnospiraceae bacterium]